MLSKNKVKYIQSLCQKNIRDEVSLFVAEGVKIIEEVIQTNPLCIHTLYATLPWAKKNKELLKNITVEIMEEEELKRISFLKTPNEVVGILKKGTPMVLPNPLQQWVLVLDTIQDPGNLGTIIRIADWFGIQNIVCSEQTVDVYNTKVIQATMGSFLRVQLHYTNLVQYLKQYPKSNIYATVLDGADVKKSKAAPNGILIIGNEGKGISEELLEIANKKITILKKGKAESLNASVATGILLSHLMG